jgi:glycosyltransferase involved in cell wall biosynthesis
MTEALSLLDRRWNARLMLVGAFEGSATESELRATRGYDRVDLVGSVPYKRIPSYFRGSSVGLVCLHPGGGHETALPVKLFEYMAAGLPVIASRFPLWERIVRECRCGLSVDPLDPEEISAAIRYLIDHPEEARRMGQNGREAVREKYNWEAEATRLVELYARLLAGEA